RADQEVHDRRGRLAARRRRAHADDEAQAQADCREVRVGHRRHVLGLISPSVAIGLGFAVATAVASVGGCLLKHRGAGAAPEVEWRRPIRSSAALLRSKWYAIGMAVATGSWGLHVAALSLAPISIVQSIIAGGLVLVTILADRVFGLQVSR